MKKTFTLLLAAAGMAMGVTDVTESITWTSEQKAEMSALNDDMSIAFSLNWNALETDSKQELFIALGSSSSNSEKVNGVGMGLFYDEETGYDLNSIRVSNSSLDYTYGYTNITDILKEKEYTMVTSAVLVYTFDKNNTASKDLFGGTLYLWLDSSEEPVSVYAGYQQAAYVDSLTNLEFNGNLVNLDSVRLYDGLVEDSAEFAAKIKNGNIPEPATATLSLLALAGLAARRRRK